MTKQLNLILNGKGGVGESLFAVNLVQALKDRRRLHRAADTDDENPTLLRFHADAEFRETVELLDQRANSFAKQSLDPIVELRKVADRGAGKRELSIAALLLIAGLATVTGFYLGRLGL